jgi:hypothetical protein
MVHLEDFFLLTVDQRKAALLQEGYLDLEETLKLKEERLQSLKERKCYMNQLAPKASKILRRNGGDLEWNSEDVACKRKEIKCLAQLEQVFPDWLLEQKRVQKVLDLCVSKGIFLLSFIEMRSDNLVGAMGTEAYKVLMTLLPHLRANVDRLDLNRVDRKLNCRPTVNSNEM